MIKLFYASNYCIIVFIHLCLGVLLKNGDKKYENRRNILAPDI